MKGMGGKSQMWFYMFLMDAGVTLLLELLAESGAKPDMTQEEWQAASPVFVARRKAAIAAIKGE